jgi:predicted ABC-type ATPase
VAERVKQGGHNVPEPVTGDVSSRVENFDHYYREVVDIWALYDNFGNEPVILEWGENV